MSLTQTVNVNDPNRSGLPRSLIYDRTLPRGFASSFKRWEVNPQTSFNIFNVGDTVRFILETSDYIDPYQSYLEVEVEFDPMDYITSTNINNFNITGGVDGINTPVTTYCNQPPIFMLDGPSTSLMDQLIIYSNAREIERIQAYDQVGMLIQDLNVPIGKRWFKQHEGYQARQPMSHDNAVYNPPQNNFGQGGTLEFQSSKTANFVQLSNDNTFVYGYDGTNNTSGMIHRQTYYMPGDGLKPFIGCFAFMQAAAITASNVFTNLFYYGDLLQYYKMPPYLAINAPYASHTRTLYGYGLEAYNGPVQLMKKSYTTEFVQFDGSCGIQGTQTAISGTYGNLSMPLASSGAGGVSINTIATMNSVTAINAQRAGAEMSLTHGSNSFWVSGSAMGDRTTAYEGPLKGPGGFIRPFSAGSALNQGIYFAPTILKHTIFNGSFFDFTTVTNCPQGMLGFQPVLLNTSSAGLRFHETRKTFLIPILSGVLGTMIPKEQWKLIPGLGCGQLLFEWKFNPFAFFASGPKFDAQEIYNNFAKLGAFSPSRDRWQIKYRFTRCRMMFDLWNFGQNVDQYLLSSNSEGIYMTSRMFTQGPTYEVPNAASATNNWQINNGIQSLRAVYFYFLSKEYMNYNWCRKNYRCSRNLTQIQLKVGQNYIPSTGPIQGHSGQLFKNSQMQQDYTPFYLELHRSVSGIFASGQYPGDDQCLPNITPEQFVVDMRPYDPSFIKDIAFNNALFHETRCRGQALYTIDLLSDPFDDSVLTGINTTNFRPIELMTRSAGDVVVTPTATTMYIFLYHDLIVRFSREGIYTAGYG